MARLAPNRHENPIGHLYYEHQAARSPQIANPGYRWVIVAAGAPLGCVAVGSMFSLPVFLTPMAAATRWSHTGISVAITIGFLAMAFGSVFWGTVTDRIGPRTVVVTGSVLLAVSLALASFSRSLLEFQLLFGLLVGTATAAIFAPMMATVTGWFDTSRRAQFLLRRICCSILAVTGRSSSAS